MNRRTFFSAITGAAADTRFPRPQKRSPNILFILADDLGWGDLSCYGNRRFKTANLDRLASQGTMYTQFYTNSPVCSPSRTAFMTGHFPARHRIHGHLGSEKENQLRAMPNFLDPAVPTVASLLKGAGYRTQHVGKWHMGHGTGAPMPDAYGFDEHRTVVSNSVEWHDTTPGFVAESTSLFVDETLRFLRANRDRPFYVNLWTLLQHAVLDPTPEQLKPFKNSGPGSASGHLGAHQIYHAALRNLDDQIGRLLSGLDELSLTENTLVLFASDNGPEDIHIANASHSAFGSPGPFRGRKRSLYEGGVRLPLIARLPGVVRAGRVDTSSVLTAVDFLPTFLKFAGVRPSRDLKLDGEDVSDILSGGGRERQLPIYWEWRFNIFGDNLNRSPMLAMRSGRWKLLMNPDRSRIELYDIPADPMELNNLAKTNEDLARTMVKRLLDWQRTLPEGPRDSQAGRNTYPWPRTVPGN